MKFPKPIQPQRVRVGAGQIALVHGIDVLDDTRRPQQLVTLDVTIYNDNGQATRARVAPHHLRGMGTKGEQEAAALAALCREELEKHPPSTAHDGVEHPLLPTDRDSGGA